MKDTAGTIFCIIIAWVSFYTGKSFGDHNYIAYPDTCAICRNHIDTVKEREMMMYINGDFVFRDEVHRAYERRMKEISKKH